MKEAVEQYKTELHGASAEEALRWALSTFGEHQVGLASSFGVEDQLLTHWFAGLAKKPVIFSLDTGRQFEETYLCMSQTMAAYQLTYQVYLPEQVGLKALLESKGPNSFYDSVENRRECCGVRKVEPLKRALSPLKIWITGQRREQSVTRTTLDMIEWDAGNGLLKLNPLVEWSEPQVWETVKGLKIPYNQLHDQGFPSIGCQPCTRAVATGEDARSGRWWWEEPEHKECGLHNRPA